MVVILVAILVMIPERRTHAETRITTQVVRFRGEWHDRLSISGMGISRLLPLRAAKVDHRHLHLPCFLD